jgi:hypothetical protein
MLLPACKWVLGLTATMAFFGMTWIGDFVCELLSRAVYRYFDELTETWTA